MPAIRAALGDDLDRADALAERRTGTDGPCEPAQVALGAEPKREVRDDLVVGATVGRVLRERGSEDLHKGDERVGGFGRQPDHTREPPGSLEAHVERPDVARQAGDPPPHGRRQLGARQERIEQGDVRRHAERSHRIVALAQLFELWRQPDPHDDAAPAAHGGLV